MRTQMSTHRVTIRPRTTVSCNCVRSIYSHSLVAVCLFVSWPPVVFAQSDVFCWRFFQVVRWQIRHHRSGISSLMVKISSQDERFVKTDSTVIHSVGVGSTAHKVGQSWRKEIGLFSHWTHIAKRPNRTIEWRGLGFHSQFWLYRRIKKSNSSNNNQWWLKDMEVKVVALLLKYYYDHAISC